MQLYNPTYYYIENFILDRLVYEKQLNSPNVVLFAYTFYPNYEPLLTEYLCDFNVLTDILLSGGESSEATIKNISDQVKNKSHEPVNLQIKDNNGLPITITNIKLKIYRPMEQKHNGDWVECITNDLFFIIEKAATNFAEDEEKKYQENMTLAYMKYLEAIDSGFPAFKAKALSGLRYELIFRLARNFYSNVNGNFEI